MLGGWESVVMVEHYARSINFQNSLKFYSPDVNPIKLDKIRPLIVYSFALS